MMAADLSKAQELAKNLYSSKALLTRLVNCEGLAILVGEGSGASMVELALGYQESIRQDLVESLRQRCDRIIADLRALGVEP